VLGWENVIVIDDDLGRSGGGTARPGFERLLAAICTGAAGAVLSIEASRLARNGRDWHTLLEFCTLVNSLIIDENGVYDPKLINDRLLLGMKGTFSELELSILRQRSQEALRLKAARDVAVPVHDTQRCQAASGKYSAALRQPQAGIGDDQPNTFQGSFLEVLEECAPALVVLLGPFTDAQNLPITPVVRRPQLTARH
jgi:Resolvase, N terminal domain